MRLIDADALKAWVEEQAETMWGLSMDEVWDAIDAAPTIDPVKHGKWTYDDEMNTGIYAICSECGESVYQAGEWLFCPRCGAKMEEGKDET